MKSILKELYAGNIYPDELIVSKHHKPNLFLGDNT